MFKVGNININKALLLAPMEDVTARGFRKLCIELGADVVYTEFVNSDGLIRDNIKTIKKLKIADEERPIGIQIYGSEIEPMKKAAKIAEEENPEVIDINAGCWVKKVARRGAGAGLLKDPVYMQKMVEEVVKSVDLPVTVKTRIGWDEDSIMILEVAKRIEDAGAKALTIHARTRTQGHSGDAQWEWINKVKEAINIPIVLNGGIFTPEDGLRAFKETTADAIMIARGAINHPWIFRQIKEMQENGKYNCISVDERIETCLRHLRYEIEYREILRHAIFPFRKYYSGYLKGLYNASSIKQQLMTFTEYQPIEDILLEYKENLKQNYIDNPPIKDS